jgi:periplasmic divalent cation tolerance protein
MALDRIQPESARDVLVVLTNLPDRASAERLARALVEQRLAACVNVLDGCTSFFRWQGSIETARELPVLIKTQRSLFARVQEAIRAVHPYELPEIVALTVREGLPAYLDWVRGETGAER